MRCKPVPVRFDQENKDFLTVYGKKFDRDLQDLIREAISEFVERKKIEEEKKKENTAA